ncbi:class I adenylate-forming enzyme family protein [Microbispora sp. GKU 823]|uniref:class I adenylate-forming enzyme family protein n=1 Tax=Microbispora sp. GKU 823 TaxID=1652100 RepID=UPI0009A29518|nr:AMP-binding protein [Microbispora sp. GKU 823]OPG04412.1 fatty acid--CoA ligase [Microbispora sp. GKU 823]
MTTREEALARLTAPGAPFEVRVEDVLGEPMEVFAHRQRSLGEILRASLRFGDREYLVTGESRLTFAGHHEAVCALAAALRDEYGVRKGDRVAVCAANRPEWIVTFWAAASLGAVAVGMNSMWAAPEIAHGLGLTEPAVLVADAPRRALAGEPGIPVLSIEDDLPVLVERHRGAAQPVEAVDEDDPAVILFTSGTTGRPKGATHSHRNVIAAVWFHLLNDAVAAETGRPQAGRRFLLVTPLFHIAALHNLAVVRLAVGDTAVLHLGRFDIARVLRLIEKEQVTNWGAVPTMLSRLVEHDLSPYDLTSLRTVSVNSAPSSPALKQRLREVLPRAGAALGTTYGLTESSTAATLASAAELLADPGTVGGPVPTMRVEIRGPGGERVPDGVEGEICLRGAQMMLGYWGDPEATRAASAPGGWFRTGDLGRIVDGRLHVSGRRSDLILRGGENVYPAEVEDRIGAHPAVRECVVLGVPHHDLGQEVAAVVVVRPGAEVTERELREHTAAGLARYKVPSRWTIRTEPLPRNATGKVNRTQVSV